MERDEKRIKRKKECEGEKKSLFEKKIKMSSGLTMNNYDSGILSPLSHLLQGEEKDMEIVEGMRGGDGGGSMREFFCREILIMKGKIICGCLESGGGTPQPTSMGTPRPGTPRGNHFR